MDEFREPPEIKRIDFSEAHFLDHKPWQCRQYEYAKGGWRTHLQYEWEFRTGPRWRAATKCRVGWHREAQWWERGQDGRPDLTYLGCIDCGKPLSEKQTA